MATSCKALPVALSSGLAMSWFMSHRFVRSIQDSSPFCPQNADGQSLGWKDCLYPTPPHCQHAHHSPSVPATPPWIVLDLEFPRIYPRQMPSAPGQPRANLDCLFDDFRSKHPQHTNSVVTVSILPLLNHDEACSGWPFSPHTDRRERSGRYL